MYFNIWQNIFVALSATQLSNSEYVRIETTLKPHATEFSSYSLSTISWTYVGQKSTRDPDRFHDELSLNVSLENKDVVLELKLNTDLIPITGKHSSEDEELCEYIGKVRGVKSSRVALSVCGEPATVNGTVFDGNHTFYIEPATDDVPEPLYYIYNRQDLLKTSHGCGINNTLGRKSRSIHYSQSRRIKTMYVKVLLVTGASVYRKKGNSKRLVRNYCRGLINEVYSYFLDLGLIVQLAARRQILPRTEKKILDKNNKDFEAPLHNFKDYLLRHDYVFKDYDLAIFLSEDVFLGTKTVGLAYTDSICSGPREGASAVISSAGSWFLTATTVAHEIGHILGLNHEEERNGIPGCPNTGPTYIMTKVGIPDEADWSQCSKQFWRRVRDGGDVDCLK